MLLEDDEIEDIRAIWHEAGREDDLKISINEEDYVPSNWGGRLDFSSGYISISDKKTGKSKRYSYDTDASEFPEIVARDFFAGLFD